jgi:purine nucleoside permease
MARNTEKNAPFVITIPRDSQMYRELMRDSQETGISIPKLVVLRCADWYRRESQGVTPLAVDVQSTSQPDNEEDENTSQMAANADAALDAWSL